MNIFEKIKNDFLNRKKEEIDEEATSFLSKITLRNRIMACIPIFDLFNTKSIDKKNDHFSISDICFIRILSNIGFLLSIALGLLCYFSDYKIFNFFIYAFSTISLFLGLSYNLDLKKKNVCRIITENKKESTLEHQDFELLKENVSIDILSNFMAKNDFKITYNNLDYFIKENAYKEDENKAKEIILSTSINKHSDDTLVPSKENIVVN